MILCCATLSLLGCGGGSSGAKSYSVGGVVSGLAAGESVILNKNGRDSLTLSSNAAFTFATPVASGSSFLVTVATQPTGQTCVVNAGSGSVSTAGVTSVGIVCTENTYTIGGTFSGLLAGRSVVLLNNAGDPLTLTANGSFTFVTRIPFGSTYGVTIGTQPLGEACEVTDGSASVGAMNVTNVSVACVPTAYTIGGSFSGLLPGGSVVLLDNAGDPLTLTANGSFSFATPLPPGSQYSVTVGTQPATQTCVLTAASGSVAMADVTDVIVQCPSENALWSFGAEPDATLPSAGLLQASDGNFYGTTVTGGGLGGGTVFKLTRAGVETVVWSFGGVGDGLNPEQSGLIQGRDGSFYGTTNYGGAHNGGIVFKLTPDGVETILWNFGAPNDGANPQAGVIQGSDGSFYGTTTVGGTHNGGTVFTVTPAGVETVLWSFDYFNTGNPGPYAGLIQASDGNFYGTTFGGGTNGTGTLFKITPDGAESVLWNFGSGTDGYSPGGNLLQASDGTIYGTTYYGGPHGGGTVFSITLAGAETVLWGFGAGNDGRVPEAGLSQGRDGYFYGTTAEGGQSGSGIVFRITPAGAETVVWDFGIFGPDNQNGIKGVGPYAGVIQASDGNLYGTTYGGGTSALGTVFKVTL